MLDKNILFILPEYYPHSGGGISTYYLNYINALKLKVKHIKVIVGSGYTQSIQKLDHEDIEIEYLRPTIFDKYLQLFKKYDSCPDFHRSIASSWAIYEQIDQGKGFDIIECCDFGLGYLPWVLEKKIPCVIRLHGSQGQIDLYESNVEFKLQAELFRQLELSMFLEADIVLSHSYTNINFFKKVIPSLYIQFSPAYFPSLDQEVNKETFNQANFALVCGRVQEWKGPEILCEALLKHNLSIPEIHWIGRDTPISSNLTKTQQLKNNYPSIWDKTIKHLPAISNQDLMAAQSTYKFGIIPSTWDMFNFTCIEFLQLGKPVICSDQAGCSYLIKHGVNGFVYQNNDTKQLAECLKLANEINPDAYVKMSIAAKETIQNELNTQKSIDPILDLYNTLYSKLKQKSTNPYYTSIYYPSSSKSSKIQLLNLMSIKDLIQHLYYRILSKLKK